MSRLTLPYLPKLTAALLLITAVVANDVTAQFDRVEKADWSGQWVWRPGTQYPNAWMAYRKSFELNNDPGEVRASIAVDSKYWLYVNGELVVREGGLKRGPTPTDTYYDIVEIGDYLIPGSNTVAVLVWYWGRSGYSHIDSGKGGLLFEATVGGQSISTDESWKVNRHSAFGWTDAPVPNGRLSEQNIAFDARNDMPDWYQPNFDDSGWQNVEVLSSAPGGPWNRLFERPIPFWRDYGLKEYENQPSLPFMSTGDTLVLDLPYNLHATPYFVIEAPEGLTVDMRTDQYYTYSIDRVTRIHSVRTEYITKEGLQSFETPAWMNGDAVLYHFPVGIRVVDVKYRETSYDADFSGWFSSSDDELDKLWIKARRTVAVSMRDYFMETADRERKQATGDGTVAILSAMHSFDEDVIPLIRKFWSEFEAWRTTENIFLSGVPGNWDIELSQQNLFAFGELGLWSYYLHSGDEETIRAMYPSIRTYLLLWEMGADGLPIPRSTGWNWYDWGVNIDEPVIETAWYYLAVSGMVKMAELTGNSQDLVEWNRRKEMIEGAFNSSFWGGNRYRTIGQNGLPDDRGNALAVLAGFPTLQMRGQLNRLLRREMHSSPYMENFVAAALFELGDADAALTRMKDRYRPMIEHRSSSLWEFWDPFVASKSHQFGSGMLRVLSRYVGGIEPIEAGYSRVRIAPQIGSLELVDIGVPTPKGTVSVRVEQDRKPEPNAVALTMDVSIPTGAAAIVGVPLVPGVLSRVDVGDKTVWQGDRGIVVVDGIEPIELTLTHVFFRVESGDWEFKEYLLPSPVRFDDVKVYPIRDRRAVIRWKASEELPGVSYTVQERLNESFETIAHLGAAGLEERASDYELEMASLTPGLHAYRVVAATNEGLVAFSDVVTYELPIGIELSASQIYPNPMTQGGHFVIGVGETQQVKVEVFNAIGKRVAQLMNDFLLPDEQYRLKIDASEFPAGTYAVVATGKGQVARRFVVIR